MVDDGRVSRKRGEEPFFGGMSTRVMILFTLATYCCKFLDFLSEQRNYVTRNAILCQIAIDWVPDCQIK